MHVSQSTNVNCDRFGNTSLANTEECPSVGYIVLHFRYTHRERFCDTARPVTGYCLWLTETSVMTLNGSTFQFTSAAVIKQVLEVLLEDIEVGKCIHERKKLGKTCR
jgi:hypothetical protein